MNDDEAFDFIKTYFYKLFSKRNLDCLDIYLAKDHFDDDIGILEKDHIRNSKEYLSKWFIDEPTIDVDVIKVISNDNVITAYLNWYVIRNNQKHIIKKGIGIFTIREMKIVKRHTYMYFSEQ